MDKNHIYASTRDIDNARDQWLYNLHPSDNRKGMDMALTHRVCESVLAFGEFGPEVLRLGRAEARVKLDGGHQDLIGHLEQALRTVSIVADAQVCYRSDYCVCEEQPSDGRPCVWVSFEERTPLSVMCSAVREAIRDSSELRRLGD
ncbi:hypothetical protein DYH10_01285 [Candidatus Saccharibacteria bacterium CPR2]|nr:hypothetical protein [Candidatus Saccharibacteria bacterium CPR2]